MLTGSQPAWPAKDVLPSSPCTPGRRQDNPLAAVLILVLGVLRHREAPRPSPPLPRGGPLGFETAQYHATGAPELAGTIGVVASRAVPLGASPPARSWSACCSVRPPITSSTATDPYEVPAPLAMVTAAGHLVVGL